MSYLVLARVKYRVGNGAPQSSVQTSRQKGSRLVQAQWAQLLRLSVGSRFIRTSYLTKCSQEFLFKLILVRVVVVVVVVVVVLGTLTK